MRTMAWCRRHKRQHSQHAAWHCREAVKGRRVPGQGRATPG